MPPTACWPGTLPPLYPEWLGDRAFGEAHGVRFPYVAREMARGIVTTKMVVTMARAEMLASSERPGSTFPPSSARLMS
jgi:trans-AT polyketide synthase/acyltransferase/oxidoreductase domain-containing protein